MSAEPLPLSPKISPKTSPQTRPRRSAPAGPRRATLALVPPAVRARRAPFVVLLLVLLAGGLVGLLLLNTASAQDAFRLHSLQSQEAALAQQQQAYSNIADGLDDPARLAARAAALGLVPGGVPVFLLPGQPWPKGAIRLGNLVYVPGAVPVTPAAPVAPVTPPAAQKPAVKKPAVKKPAATKPAAITGGSKLAGTRTSVTHAPATKTTVTTRTGVVHAPSSRTSAGATPVARKPAATTSAPRAPVTPVTPVTGTTGATKPTTGGR